METVKNAFDELYDFLSEVAAEVNSGQGLRSLQDLNRPDLYQHDVLKPHFQVFRDGDEELYVPRATEALRMLSQVKQRFDAAGKATPLVERFRMDVQKRIRPIRDLYRPGAVNKPAGAKELQGKQAQIANIAPARFTSFSSYQVGGWAEVELALTRSQGLVITAPTGAGKTEVFMLPLFHHLASTQGQNGQYFLLYPRVELLKDQLLRALLYSWGARQRANPVDIPVGLQFTGVRKHDRDTIQDGQLFDQDGFFLTVPECPACESGRLRIDRQAVLSDTNQWGRGESRVRTLTCDHCSADFHVTISRHGHFNSRTRVLLMTAESLERYYLMPRAQYYLSRLSGIIADEAHLYEGLYGVHVYQLLRRIEALTGGRPLAKLAVSATIGDPQNFANKLFYGTQGGQARSYLFDKEAHAHETDGLEVFFTLQVPDEARSSAPLLIQSIMALGHGVLIGEENGGPENQLQVTFIDSLDSSERITEQVKDAEHRNLWRFRTIVDEIEYDSEKCPETTPACCSIYSAGECWRGLVVGADCTQDSSQLRDWELRTELISSQSAGRLAAADAAIATPTLEVGVDDKRIRAVVQYGAPRSTASYTQRRGRAGRGGRDISYTVMVLSDSPTDHYALTNRHSLQSGKNQIPLNTQNLVLKQIHDRLEEERKRYAQHVNKNPGIDPEGTVYWIYKVLGKCPRIRANHRHFLDDLATAIGEFEAKRPFEAKENLQVKFDAWINSNLAAVKPILDMRRSLQVLAEDFPAQLQAKAEQVRDLGEVALAHPERSDEFLASIRELNTLVGDLAFDTDDDSLTQLTGRLIQFSRAFRNQQNGVMDYSEAQRTYSFFRRLRDWLNKQYFLWSPPDDMKAVLQALFYFHHDLPDGHLCKQEGCEVALSYLIPDNFFTSLKPLLFQRRDARGDVVGEEQESIDKLGQLFFPYRLSYRYDPGSRRLSTVDTTHNPAWVDRTVEPIQVGLDIPAIGLETGGFLIPQQVPIKSVGTDHSGRQLAKLCTGCFNVHDFDRRQACCPGAALELVNFYANPAVTALFEPSENQQDRLQIAEQMCAVTGNGTTQILGADVTATRYQKIGREYFPVKKGDDVDSFDFEARYRLPLQYKVEGRAVGWQVGDLCRKLAANPELQLRFDEDAGELYEHALDTATSVLHRALAGVSGVRLDSFQTAFDPETGYAWVWEVYEGGAGLTEIFAHTIRRDPLVIFEEMVGTVLCPIGLSEEALQLERANPDSKNGNSHLLKLFAREAQRFGLPVGNVTIRGLYHDAQPELVRMLKMLRDGEARNNTCIAKDGCPACIHGGVRRRKDERLPSRTLAGLILEECIQTLDHEELVKAMTQFPLHGTMPRLLGQEGEENRVLRF